MIGITSKNDDRMNKSLKQLKKNKALSELDRYGQMGVNALAEATPRESGETANSWAYRIKNDRLGPRIEWYNTHKDDAGGASVVILIQYGHGTRTGGYVQGYDFINPAMRPVFDKIAKEIWKKVKVT